MQQEKDFLKREIQKLNIFLTNLIAKVIGINTQNSSDEIQNISESLKENFDLTFREIIDLPKDEFYSRIQKLHETHLDKISDLLYECGTVAKSNECFREIDKQKMLLKSIEILDFLDENSNTYSLSRSVRKQRATIE